MIKKISINELRAGMNVCGVGRAHGEDLFFMNNILIKNDEDVRKFAGNDYVNVFIDTSESYFSGPARKMPSTIGISGENGPACLEEAIEGGGCTLNGALEAPKDKRASEDDEPAAFRGEVKQALKIKHEALNVIKDVLQDARLGKSIKTDKINAAINNIVDSIFRNRHALTSLARIKAYDDYTFTHSVNVCILSIALGRNLDFTREDLQTLGAGALLHDIGKILLPEHLINKPGLYTPGERVQIQEHPSLGAEFISNAADIKQDSVFVVSQHHERYDGTGYQLNLEKDSIHRFARITGAVDMYDAMTTDRVYRKGLLPTEVLKILYLRGPEYFGPGLVDALIRCIGIYPIGSLVELNTGEIGLVTSVNQSDLLQPRLLIVADKNKKLRDRPMNVDLKHEENLWIQGVVEPRSYKIDLDILLS